MTSTETKRRLLWHGILIFLFGLLAGMAVPLVANPRMGVAAHLGGVMSGIFLLLVGLIWEDIKLSSVAARTALWLFLYSSYTGWLAQFLAACWGTSEATPIGGAGYRGAPWQENVVWLVAISFSVTITLACILALWGLRKHAVRLVGGQLAP